MVASPPQPSSPRPSGIERLVDALGGQHDFRFFRAPGRVNLMGDHTDYNDGFVLPVAVDRECVVGVRPRPDARVVARSLDMEGAVEVAADGSADPAAVKPAWGRLVGGVLRALAEAGRPPDGAELVLASSVPPGAGLSSSAAVGVAVALALCDLTGFELAPADLAVRVQRGETLATGVPCGVMDQLASIAGVADHALLLDCRSLRSVPVAVPEDLAVVVVHSGVSRELSHTPYAERRAACEEAARRLGVPALRDAPPDDVAGDPVARHVVTENARVAAAAMALAAGDRATLGEVFAASQASLRDDFDCSTLEIDALVALLVEAGAVGARLTGAGWGGCVVALVDHDRVDAVRAVVAGRRHWSCRAVDGAGLIAR